VRINKEIQDMKRVLIAGATGYLGQHLVKGFKKHGYWVRALARNADKLAPLSASIDDVFIAEVTDPHSLRGVCSDIDIVVSTIGITKQQDNLTYMDVDYQGNKNLLDEATQAGVAKFVYISVFNAERMAHVKGVQAKLTFTAALKQSGLPYLVVSPNGFFSDMRDYLEMAKQGRGYVFGSGECRINPIHGADLADACVQAAESDTTELRIGGPDVLTHNEILGLAFAAVGKPVRITRIPLWVRNSLLAGLRLVTSVKMYGPLEFFMTVLAMDMVAPCSGTHHLSDFFVEQVAQGKST
jgi:uncharacterized protein YbjT (DUF2867 family)